MWPDDKERNGIDSATVWAVLITLGITVFVLFLMSVYTIPAGHRGVLLTFGKPDMVSIGEGLGFKIPIAQKIKKMSVQTELYEAPASAASKDLQVVSSKVAVNYHLNPELVPEIYQMLGMRAHERKIIAPAVQEVVKASTATFTAEELVTLRPQVKADITIKITERLATRGLIVEEISITDFDFSDAFNDAIEAKVTAEQEAMKAERDLARIEFEAQQQIETAKAQAESLKLQKHAVTDELIRLREVENQAAAIEKWNGILPTVTSGVVPFIEVGT